MSEKFERSREVLRTNLRKLIADLNGLRLQYPASMTTEMEILVDILSNSLSKEKNSRLVRWLHKSVRRKSKANPVTAK